MNEALSRRIPRLVIVLMILPVNRFHRLFRHDSRGPSLKRQTSRRSKGTPVFLTNFVSIFFLKEKNDQSRRFTRKESFIYSSSARDSINYLTRSSGLSHITVHISTMKHRKLLLFVAESRVCTISEHCIIVFFILI